MPMDNPYTDDENDPIRYRLLDSHQKGLHPIKCGICEFFCDIQAGKSGRCRMMTQRNGAIVERHPDSYSTLFPISIQTMPALHVYPNHKFLQVSSLGCNFSCTGCISEILAKGTQTMAGTLKHRLPGEVVDQAVKENCLGIAFCINDPTVSFFSFLELAKTAKKNDLAVGFSTNGYFSQKALDQLIPYTDFVNIGFKGFFGGYRTTRAFEMLHAILVSIGADDPDKVSRLWLDLIDTDFLKEFHETVHLPDAYGGIIDRLAEQTDCVETGNQLKAFINDTLIFMPIVSITIFWSMPLKITGSMITSPCGFLAAPGGYWV